MTYDNGPICPHCGGQTHYYDKAKRIVKGKYGEVRKIYVYRYRYRVAGKCTDARIAIAAMKCGVTMKLEEKEK